jgi:hypothetical protein
MEKDDPVNFPKSASLPFGSGANRFGPGDTNTARVLTTIRSERIRVPVGEGLTHLQFRRFAGCPICNVHLRSVARRHDEVEAAGICEVVVFHSPVEAMLPHQGELPFAAITDPGRELYTAFGVETAWQSVLHARFWTTRLRPVAYAVVARGVRAGGHHAVIVEQLGQLGDRPERQRFHRRSHTARR